MNGKLELIEHLGEHVLVHLLAEDGTEFITKMEQPPEQARGDMIAFTADPAKAHAFDKATGKRK